MDAKASSFLIYHPAIPNAYQRTGTDFKITTTSVTAETSSRSVVVLAQKNIRDPVSKLFLVDELLSSTAATE